MLGRIKKDDAVVVISGRDKGKEGVVLEVDSKKEAVLVKGIALVCRHKKARKSGEQSKIVKEESYITACKLMPICKSCKKGCRVQVRLLDGGKKARVCHRCKEAF